MESQIDGDDQFQGAMDNNGSDRGDGLDENDSSNNEDVYDERVGEPCLFDSDSDLPVTVGSKQVGTASPTMAL